MKQKGSDPFCFISPSDAKEIDKPLSPDIFPRKITGRSMNFKGAHIISVRDFGKEDLLYILDCAARMEEKPRPALMTGLVMASLFFVTTNPPPHTNLSAKRGGGGAR